MLKDVTSRQLQGLSLARPSSLLLTSVISICLLSCTSHPSGTTEGVLETSQSEFIEFISSSEVIDFSMAGTNFSETDMTPVVETAFNVEDFGAVVDDKLDDTKAIQNTIFAAEKNGGGIIEFNAGVYHINNDPTFGSIKISQSNIVLRGVSKDSTTLKMTRSMPPAEPGRKWTGPAMIQFKPKTRSTPNSKSWMLPSDIKVEKSADINSKTIFVSSSSYLKAGDHISLQLQSQDAASEYFKYKTIPAHWENTNKYGLRIREYHEIENVEGNQIKLRTPILSKIDTRFPWYIRSEKLIEHVGFENINFEGNFHETFVHHKDATHDSGYRAIELSGTAHSWVRNCHFENVSTAVTVKDGANNSVLLNEISGNGGHFSFQSEFGTRNLIGLNLDRTNKGQFHGASVSHFSVGTVIWRYKSEMSGGFDLHASLPRHTLIDNYSAPAFSRWGGNYKDLPNHGRGLVIWNFDHTGDQVGNHFDKELDFWQLPVGDQRYGFLTAINPVMVGYKGPVGAVNTDNVSHVESLGALVAPSSLYEAQIKHRLGKMPEWMQKDLQSWSRLKSSAMVKQ